MKTEERICNRAVMKKTSRVEERGAALAKMYVLRKNEERHSSSRDESAFHDKGG